MWAGSKFSYGGLPPPENLAGGDSGPQDHPFRKGGGSGGRELPRHLLTIIRAFSFQLSPQIPPGIYGVPGAAAPGIYVVPGADAQPNLGTRSRNFAVNKSCKVCPSP